MCEPEPHSSLMEGYLWKRPRGRHRSVGPKARFKRRFFRLTDDKLEYWKDKKKNPKGSFQMENVKVIEEVHRDVFDVACCFQIANKEECMYMAARTQREMHQWMAALRQVVQRKRVHMLPFYHCGFYDQKRWTCCKRTNPKEEGCTETGSLSTTNEENGILHDQELLSYSTSTENPMLSSSISSGSTLTSPDLCLSVSSNASTHQSPTKLAPQIVLHQTEPREKKDEYARERMDSGFASGTSALSGKSRASAQSNSSSRADSMYSVLEPQPALGTGQKDKQTSTHLLPIHQPLRPYKSVPLENKSASPDNKSVLLETVTENGGCENNLSKRNHHASTCIKVAKQPITAVAFVSSHVIVYATRDCHVCIYDTSKGELLYDVKLTYTVSTLDVWNNYILVGTYPFQLFEIKTDRLRRIVVMDPEDNSPQMAASSYLGAFLPNGCFATANENGSEIVLWPFPTEERSIITEVATRIPFENNIYSMWGSGNHEQPLLAVIRKDSSQILVKVFDCSDSTYHEVDELPTFEQLYLMFQTSGRLEIEMKYDSSVTTTGRSQSPRVHIPVALKNGVIVLYGDLTPFSTCNSYEHSQISSLACIEKNGSTLVAAGYENGKLGLWGGVYETKEYNTKEEIFTTQVFLGDSFYRESLLCDYYEFTVDFNGGKFENYPSYSLEIPGGAIPKGEKVVIKTGIMKYGPCGLFECPDNIEIVSPVVWFSSNNPALQFLKPAVLELQHCSNTQDSLVLLKADHDNLKNSHGTLKFQVQTPSNKCTSNKRYQCAEIKHFCLYCNGIYSNADGIKQGFRLTPVERVGYMNKTHQVIFCLSYNLSSCRKAIQEQYPTDDYRIEQALSVHFQGDTQIDIDFPRESSGWLIAQKYPGHPIGLKDLNWKEKFPSHQALISAHKNREYPPRFILEFCGKNAEKSETITIGLSNVMEPVVYDITLYMPSAEEEGQEKIQVCPCSQGLSDDSGIVGDQSSSQLGFYPFPSYAGP